MFNFIQKIRWNPFQDRFKNTLPISSFVFFLSKQIPFYNKYEWNTQLSYNPMERRLYAWDNGYLVYYNVTVDPSLNELTWKRPYTRRESFSNHIFIHLRTNVCITSRFSGRPRIHNSCKRWGEKPGAKQKSKGCCGWKYCKELRRNCQTYQDAASLFRRFWWHTEPNQYSIVVVCDFLTSCSSNSLLIS